MNQRLGEVSSACMLLPTREPNIHSLILTQSIAEAFPEFSSGDGAHTSGEQVWAAV